LGVTKGSGHQVDCAEVLVASQRVVMLYGWEGNHGSGIQLAMHHRLSGRVTYGLGGLEKGDEHQAYALRWSTLCSGY